MNDASLKTGSFTLPGEAGYEDLTIKLARKWGADTIRDSDGTVLSDAITSLSYSIYSTLCLVRADNAWAKAHRDCLQQSFLMSVAVTAEGPTVTIDPLKGYFREQFTLNTKDDPKEWWQVFDRTTGKLVPLSQWSFDAAKGLVTITDAAQWHKYTVNFLTVRIWEEISMYNHITNNWGNKEHLLEVDPFYAEAQEFMLGYLDRWLKDHPKTQVVRFTSMFYNFTWFWGDDPKNRYIYSDWADYQMMVSPAALLAFEKAKGYRLTSEDFVNKGLYNCTHNVPSPRYLDWMDFINEFVVLFGKKCVDLVHKHGKKAYVFYDDHHVGVEPYGERFKQFGFDGIIKCVFNGFEARKCAGVKDVQTRELRLHPYLFPTGLKGEPTFKEGGNPTLDAKNFWVNIRRALLREPVDRIGLGGYLHLVEAYPDFVDYIEKLAGEFRMLKGFHADGRPYAAPCKVAVLTAWGRLRSWICSGHMTPGHELNELIESLAGIPVDVEFISFDDIVRHGIPSDVKVIINAGRLDSAWSGGDNWTNPKVIEAVTGWVAQGGGFIGVAEPSAARHSSQYFQLAHVLGVDRELGLSINIGKYAYNVANGPQFLTQDMPGEPDFGSDIDGVYALGGGTTVLADRSKSVKIATNSFGRGRAVYFAGHKFSPENVRMMHRAMFWAAGRERDFGPWTCSNIYTECAYYPGSKKLVVINNSGERQETDVLDAGLKAIKVALDPHGIAVLTV
jgi:beta-D-galactosyl-(1->4)-L-rhamnose phosphorylase